MADLLVKHLKTKGDEHSALSLLSNQWGFDEKIIPKALQNVGNLFPHYSRHDESHSKQILVNIERLLGENINLLTATDTWLLLESAYWHDIGMVVPERDLQEALDEPGFQEFLGSISLQPHHELNRFATIFKLNSASTWFSGADTPLDAVSKFRELMAEWFRRKHPARSEQIVQAPWSAAGISSPRTELIPARLFRLLGRICQMHGAPFSELLSLENGLPFREAGLAQEDCHPRFVACLLRMGDLLDLDDNRFCPVMQGIAGENRPQTSRAHEDKHAGIRHLRIDRERIEVTAECETIDGYLETFRWFDWLKQEIHDQMANWRDIVPSRELGLLPMLGPMSVKLSGNLQILREGERPKFNIDAEKILALLQGKNLYSDRFVCVRELLQNAVDATLLRIWLTDGKSQGEKVWDSPFQANTATILNRDAVEVDLIESSPTEGIKHEKSLWTLTIRDRGTGVSRNDLEYMLKIGGSQRNTQRQREINRMPEWMKPSGAFGIGLQSAFMLCDKISFVTKSIFSNEIFDVTMYSPTGPKDGLVLLKKLNDDISRPFGTTMTLQFELDAFSKSWSISHGVENSIAAQLVDTVDPVLDDSFPYEGAVLADQIGIFSRYSLVPIHAMLHISTDQTRIDADRADLTSNENLPDWVFINDGEHQSRLWYKPGFPSRHSDSVATFYRGQHFEAPNLHFPHVQIGIDLMSGKAGAWLNFNRDKISSEATEVLGETVLSALERAVRADIENQRNCPLLASEGRPRYSMFLQAMALQFGSRWRGLADMLDDAWLDMRIPDGSKTFREFFDSSEWTIGEASSGNEPPLPCDILVGDNWQDRTLDIVLCEWQKEPIRTVQVLGPQDVIGPSELFVGPETPMGRAMRFQREQGFFRVHYKLMREPQQSYDASALATLLFRAARESHGNRRFILNCRYRWSALALDPETRLVARRLFKVTSADDHHFLIPFLFLGRPSNDGVQVQATQAQIEALARWTQPRLSSPATIDVIRQNYSDLVSFIDEEIMRPTIFWERWRRMRGLSQ